MSERLNIPLIRPGSAIYDVVGGAQSQQRSLSGMTEAKDFTGGGLVTAKFMNCRPNNEGTAALRYLSYLGGKFNSGTRTLWVPIWNDQFWAAPADWKQGDTMFPLSTYSDGSTFSDGSSFANRIIESVASAAAALNAATVSFYAYGGTELLGGEWFGINHTNKGKRVYRVIGISSYTLSGSGEASYTVTIDPPLREAIVSGDTLEWQRPEFLARVEPGTTIPLPVVAGGVPTVDMSFVEASWEI